MQDNATEHATKDTLVYIANKGLYPIFWPANSPDLNLIKTLQNKIKNYIKEKYPDIHRSYPKLRAAVVEAWELIIYKDILDLIRSILERC